MKRFRLLASISTVILLTVSIRLEAQQRKYDIQVGQPHPEFVLPNIETGEPVSLSQFRGKKVLLIHFASW